MIGRDDLLSIDKLGNAIKNQKITVFFVTTALFNTLVDLNLSSLKNIRKILFGGEKVSLVHTKKALDYLGGEKIIHVYGPTESCVFSTFYPINKIEKNMNTIPIGKPLANTKVLVLDKRKKLLSIGIPGELCISGDGLSSGYHKREDLTKEKFISNPYLEKEMMYFTGDIVKWLPDGNLEFLGRIDNQIKIRGFRIELGEIESQLLSHNKIKESVVIAKDKEGDKYLVAYYVSDEEIEVTELKTFLSRKLSDYLIPAYFIQLGALPLTSNGKIDIKALPEPEVEAGEEYIAPSNEIEKKLVKIWSEILIIEPENISINRSFFELGGHSLKATVMVNKIFRELNVEIPLTEIFIKQTVENLADYIITIQPNLVDELENTEIKEITL
jgi:acyl-coenzyme A synthetase/AMP-(fatty) acid ligase/acyl carrier protein